MGQLVAYLNSFILLNDSIALNCCSSHGCLHLHMHRLNDRFLLLFQLIGSYDRFELLFQLLDTLLADEIGVLELLIRFS